MLPVHFVHMHTELFFPYKTFHFNCPCDVKLRLRKGECYPNSSDFVSSFLILSRSSAAFSKSSSCAAASISLRRFLTSFASSFGGRYSSCSSAARGKSR